MTESQFQTWGEGAPVVMMDRFFVALLAAALAVFLVRAFRRRLGAADFVIIGVTFLSSALILVLNSMPGHQLVTFWRYHYPGYVLALGYAAHAVVTACGRWKRAAAVAFVAAAAVWTVAGGVRAIRHSHKYERHAADNWKACDEWAAEVIRSDWKGPARGEREQIDPDFYITDYRPLVFAHTARTAYSARARMVTVYRHVIAGRERMPDYFVLFDSEEEDADSFYPGVGRKMIAERKTRYGRFAVYRTVGGQGGAANE